MVVGIGSLEAGRTFAEQLDFPASNLFVDTSEETDVYKSMALNFEGIGSMWRILRKREGHERKDLDYVIGNRTIFLCWLSVYGFWNLVGFLPNNLIIQFNYILWTILWTFPWNVIGNPFQPGPYTPLMPQNIQSTYAQEASFVFDGRRIKEAHYGGSLDLTDTIPSLLDSALSPDKRPFDRTVECKKTGEKIIYRIRYNYD